MTREEMLAAVLNVLSDTIGEYGLHTGGSYGIEVDGSDKWRILEDVAVKIVDVIIPPRPGHSAP